MGKALSSKLSPDEVEPYEKGCHEERQQGRGRVVHVVGSNGRWDGHRVCQSCPAANRIRRAEMTPTRLLAELIVCKGNGRTVFQLFHLAEDLCHPLDFLGHHARHLHLAINVEPTSGKIITESE